jgi:hypothetical protein
LPEEAFAPNLQIGFEMVRHSSPSIFTISFWSEVISNVALVPKGKGEVGSAKVKTQRYTPTAVEGMVAAVSPEETAGAQVAPLQPSDLGLSSSLSQEDRIRMVKRR